jgi:serine protease
MRTPFNFATAIALLLSLLVSGPASAQPEEAPGSTARLIIKFRPGTAPTADERRQAQAYSDRVRRLADRSVMLVRTSRDLGSNMVGVTLAAPLAGSALDDKLATLRDDPEVEFAEIDHRRYARALPNDPRYATQWYQQGVEASATNFEAAWDTTSGSSDTIIAVLDTGIRFEHPDLSGRVLPGYDFVSGESASSFVSANDGDGWDADASDPGDWVSVPESQSGPLRNCDVGSSSWHGTRVAAMIGATTDNAAGIAGGLWSGQVLPVRVLGKCGGYDSDIIAGMRWAAGLPVSGTPPNPTPARIINLSLGSSGSCVASYRSAFTELSAAGVLVVASAGNDSGPVETPANCSGALAVAGLRQVGTKVGYSSLGSQVSISAPAGNCPELETTFLCSYSLVTADNTGTTVPASSSYTDDFNYNIGTSFSAPIVSAVAGLMYSVNNQLSAAEFTSRIKASARPFPPPEPGLPTCPSLDPQTAQCNCTTTTCGAGIADAPGAVAEALRPMARVVKPGGAEAGRNIALDGSSSDAARNRVISAYAWTGVSGNPVFVGATNGSSATVAVPAVGRVTVRLTVTDDLGRIDASDVTLGAAASSGGGGGGGAIHPFMLFALALLLGRRRRY